MPSQLAQFKMMKYTLQREQNQTALFSSRPAVSLFIVATTRNSAFNKTVWLFRVIPTQIAEYFPKHH
jgi:hypothetical protein